MCDRVAILDQGHLRYCGSVNEIGDYVNQRTGQTQIQVTFHLTGDAEQVSQAINHVRSQDKNGDNIKVHQCDSTGSHVVLIAEFASQDVIDRAIDQLRSASISIRGFGRESKSLEDAFLQILDDPPSIAENNKNALKN